MPVVGQTPCTIIKGGGGKPKFSDECVVALANIGLTPDDFGTYEDVRAQQSAAREKVRKANAKEIDPTTGQPVVATDHDRFIAKCQSGHLTQNSTQQRERGNACSNATDGYSDAKAPCAPHYGNASEPGTEHYIITRKESNKPDGKQPTGGAEDKASYPPDQRAADDAKRNQDVQKAMAGNNDKLPKELAPAKSKGSAAEEQEKQKKADQTFEKMQADRAKAAAEVKNSPEYKKAAASVDPKKLGVLQQDENGKAVAECIEAFRQAGLRDMKENAGSQESIDKAKAKAAEAKAESKSDPKKTNEQVAKEKLEAAKEREEAAVKEREKKAADQKGAREEQDRKDSEARLKTRNEQKTKRDELREEHKDDPEKLKEKMASLKTEQQDARNKERDAQDKKSAEVRAEHRKDRDAASEDVSNKRAEREAAERKVDDYKDAQCRADQGERIRDKKSPESNQPDGLTGGFGKKQKDENGKEEPSTSSKNTEDL